jgi:hypothetical protein
VLDDPLACAQMPPDVRVDDRLYRRNRRNHIERYQEQQPAHRLCMTCECLVSIASCQAHDLASEDNGEETVRSESAYRPLQDDTVAIPLAGACMNELPFHGGRNWLPLHDTTPHDRILDQCSRAASVTTRCSTFFSSIIRLISCILHIMYSCSPISKVVYLLVMFSHYSCANLCMNLD